MHCAVLCAAASYVRCAEWIARNSGIGTNSDRRLLKWRCHRTAKSNCSKFFKNIVESKKGSASSVWETYNSVSSRGFVTTHGEAQCRKTSNMHPVCCFAIGICLCSPTLRTVGPQPSDRRPSRVNNDVRRETTSDLIWGILNRIACPPAAV